MPPSQESHLTVENLGQYLVQIMRGSATPHESLLHLTETLGEAFLAEDCLILIRDPYQTITQSILWCPGQSATVASPLSPQLKILEHPAIRHLLSRPTQTAEPVVTVDLQITKDSTAILPPDQTVDTCDSSDNLDEGLPLAKAVLAVPTLFQQTVNGVIVLMRSHPHQWTAYETELLKTVSDQIAIAIAQAQLERQMQQQMRYQSLMDSLTIAIRSNQPLNAIYQLAVEGLVGALQVDRGFLLMVKYSDPMLKNRAAERLARAKVTVEYAYPIDGSHPQPQEEGATADAESHSHSWLKYSFLAADCSICRQLFVDWAEPVVIPVPGNTTRPASDQPLDSQMAPIFDLDTMPSLLLIPLENQGTVMGSLLLQQKQQRFWQADEVAFVKLVAAQLSTAIIQSRTLRQVQSLVDERTAQLQRSLDVQAKLYEKTRQQVDQLRTLNQIMEEFLSTMSHELLTPLTSMTLAIRMLRQAELSPEQRNRYLEILEQQCLQETNLINDLLALQKLESGSIAIRFQPFDIRYPIRDATQSFADFWAKKRLHLELILPDRPLNICTDLDSLNRILKELLANAGKYANADTTVTLEVGFQASQQLSQVVLTLSNIGPGITPEELPYIFDKFRRGKGVTQQAIPGTGLGLALVKGLVEHLSGAIAVTSIPLDNHSAWKTCFTLTLPQSPDPFAS